MVESNMHKRKKNKGQSQSLRLDRRTSYSRIKSYFASGSFDDRKLQQHSGDSLHSQISSQSSSLSSKNLHKLVKKHGVDEVDDNGQTPVHIAAAEGHLLILKFLLRKGGEPNREDNNGWTALHCAAAGGHLAVVEYLLNQKSVDCLAVNKEKTSVLHYLARRPYPDVDAYVKVCSTGYP